MHSLITAMEFIAAADPVDPGATSGLPVGKVLGLIAGAVAIAIGLGAFAVGRKSGAGNMQQATNSAGVSVISIVMLAMAGVVGAVSLWLTGVLNFLIS